MVEQGAAVGKGNCGGVVVIGGGQINPFGPAIVGGFWILVDKITVVNAVGMLVKKHKNIGWVGDLRDA